jgi:mannose-1-phosphate guanylyltransferase
MCLLLSDTDSAKVYGYGCGHETANPVDKKGNMVISANNYNAFIGVKEIIFVYGDTANLVMKNEFSRDVKSIYSELERKNIPLLD